MTTTEGAPPRANSLEASLAFRLGRAHRTVRAAWQARLADLGLSSAQASTLRAVLERPDAGLRELARTLGTDPMNAKRLADGLQDAGLIESRVVAQDRRLRVLVPTDAGRRLGAEVARRAQAWSATLDQIIGPGEAAATLATLDRLERGVAALDARDDAAAEATQDA
jgi:DNA-binding MarR family transcriptional regulator